MCGFQIQFVVGMLHAAQSIYVQCPFYLWMQWALIIYGITILGLFLNFYFRAYVSPHKTPKVSVCCDVVNYSSTHLKRQFWYLLPNMDHVCPK